jgi:hypothetical protein
MFIDCDETQQETNNYWVHLVLRPLLDYCTQPQMICDSDCGEIGGMKIGRGNRSTRRKPAPAPLCPPQIPHDYTGFEPGKPATNRLSYGAANEWLMKQIVFKLNWVSTAVTWAPTAVRCNIRPSTLPATSPDNIKLQIFSLLTAVVVSLASNAHTSAPCHLHNILPNQTWVTEIRWMGRPKISINIFVNWLLNEDALLLSCVLVYYSTEKTEAVSFYETSVNFSWTM